VSAPTPKRDEIGGGNPSCPASGIGPDSGEGDKTRWKGVCSSERKRGPTPNYLQGLCSSQNKRGEGAACGERLAERVMGA